MNDSSVDASATKNATKTDQEYGNVSIHDPHDEGDGVIYVGPAVRRVNVKQGKKCCGGCCDMRRAVIIVDLVNVLVCFFSLLGVLFLEQASKQSEQFDDPQTKQALEQLNNLPFGVLIAVTVIKIIISLCGAAGGYTYNVCLTGMCFAMYCVAAVLSIVQLNIGSFLLNGFFAYPHLYFIQEVRQGIMTKENYPNEKYSCCCV